MSLIDDPIKGLELCKKHITILETDIDRVKSLIETCNDERLVMKLGMVLAKSEGHLVKWVEMAQRFQHESYAQGKTRRDLTAEIAKKRR